MEYDLNANVRTRSLNIRKCACIISISIYSKRNDKEDIFILLK